MRVLVTGAAGAVGHYFCDWVATHVQEAKLVMTSREGMWETPPIDLCKVHEVEGLVEYAKPDCVFHFASNPHVAECFAQPLAFLHNNVTCTANLLDVLRRLAPKARVLLASTPEVYGALPGQEGNPVQESQPLCPSNPYGASKAAQEMIASAYWRAYGLPVVITRAGTYINPRRKDLFSTAFARQVVEVERGKVDEIRHGNLDSTRSFCDVRDLCEAYWLALRLGVPGEAYNIGGKQWATTAHVLTRLCKLAGIVPKLVRDPALLRPVDVKWQVLDTWRFESLTGWKPRISLEESLGWLLREVRKQ